jgi:hypothetical protein
MTVRDRALPALDRARARLQTVGLRRYAVTRRVQTWSAAKGAGGVLVSSADVVLTPTPRLEKQTATAIKSWFGGGYVPNAAGELVLAELRVGPIAKPWVDAIAGTTGGYDLATLAPTTGLLTRLVYLVTGDDFSGTEVYDLVYPDAGGPWGVYLYLRRGAPLT